jgi:hypothetical protein
MRCSRCQQENPAGVKFCGGSGTPFQRLAEGIQPPPSSRRPSRNTSSAGSHTDRCRGPGRGSPAPMRSGGSGPMPIPAPARELPPAPHCARGRLSDTIGAMAASSLLSHPRAPPGSGVRWSNRCDSENDRSDCPRRTLPLTRSLKARISACRGPLRNEEEASESPPSFSARSCS